MTEKRRERGIGIGIGTEIETGSIAMTIAMMIVTMIVMVVVMIATEIGAEAETEIEVEVEAEAGVGVGVGVGTGTITTATTTTTITIIAEVIVPSITAGMTAMTTITGIGPEMIIMTITIDRVAAGIPVEEDILPMEEVLWMGMVAAHTTVAMMAVMAMTSRHTMFLFRHHLLSSNNNHPMIRGMAGIIKKKINSNFFKR